MNEFMRMYDLKNLINKKTCFKNSGNLSTIPKNCPTNLQNSTVFEAGITDLLKPAVIVLKQYSPNQKPKVMSFRNCKNFQNDLFRAELDEFLNYNLSNVNIQKFSEYFHSKFTKHACY